MPTVASGVTATVVVGAGATLEGEGAGDAAGEGVTDPTRALATGSPAPLEGVTELSAIGVLLVDTLTTTIKPTSTSRANATPPIDPISTQLGPSPPPLADIGRPSVCDP
jgi:hypothetical protein